MSRRLRDSGEPIESPRGPIGDVQLEEAGPSTRLSASEEVSGSSTTMKKRRRISSSGPSSRSKTRSISPIKRAVAPVESFTPPLARPKPRDSSDIPLGSPSPSLPLSQQDGLDDERVSHEEDDTAVPELSLSNHHESGSGAEEMTAPSEQGDPTSSAPLSDHGGGTTDSARPQDLELEAGTARSHDDSPAIEKIPDTSLDDTSRLLTPPATAQTSATLTTSRGLSQVAPESEAKEDLPDASLLQQALFGEPAHIPRATDIDEVIPNPTPDPSEPPVPLITPVSLANTEPLEETPNEEGEEEIDAEGEMDMDPDAVPGDTPASATDTRSGSPLKPLAKAKAKPTQAKKAALKASKDSAKPKVSAKGTKGITKKVVAKKEKTKVESIKESAKRAGLSSSPAPETPGTSGTTTPAHRADSVDTEDDGVYCICRKPYKDEDEDVVMVACDGCDDWFHPACVKIDESKLDLLDSYICARCEKTTTLRTKYKRVCKRERCDKSLNGNGKYCSSACAFRHMAEQVPPTTNKKLLKQLSSFFVGLPPPQSNISVIHHLDTPPTSAKSDNLSTTSMNGQITTIDRALAVIAKRQEILRQAIARCETLVLPTLPEVETGDKKNKKRSGGGDDRPCGWDRKFTWTDEEVDQWTPGVPEDDEMDGDVCMAPKRRCDRHQGWQKITTASLDLEGAQLVKRKKDLEGQVRLFQTRSASLLASEKAQLEFNERRFKVKAG